MPTPAPGMMGLGNQTQSPGQPNLPGNISVDPSGWLYTLQLHENYI